MARRRRTDVLVGAAAALALAAALAGVPAGLIMAFGVPIPHTVPTLSLLTRRLDTRSVLAVCGVVVWLAWLQLACCVLAEVAAVAHGTGMPRRVPLAGGTQAVAHRLVSAVLLLSATVALPAAFVKAPPGMPGPAVTSAGPAAAVAADRNGPGSGVIEWAGEQAAHRDRVRGERAAVSEPAMLTVDVQPMRAGDRGPGHHAGKVYVVKPPVGRFHESLWEIAERHLGDGRRYREIFALNRDRPQPDGSMLTMASLIRPGWVLRMPDDARGPGIETLAPGGAPRRGQDHPSHHRGGPALGPRPTVPGAPGSRDRAQPPGPRPRAHPAEPEPAAPARTGGPVEPEPGGPASAADQPGAQGPPAGPLGSPVTGVLAAGILAALAGWRRRQEWHRTPGRRTSGPGPSAAQAEAALAGAAAVSTASLLDTGLRRLAETLAGQGRGVPTVFAVHLGERSVDLWVEPDGDGPVEPWHAVGDGRVWRTALVDEPTRRDRAAGRPSPYPGLVPLGADATGEVLVDLAAAPGPIAVLGDEPMVRAVLAAITAQLATSAWSGRVHLSVAGLGSDLAVLAPARVHCAASLGEALTAMEAWARRGADPAEPHYLITAVAPSQPERGRLLRLARLGSCACVIAGRFPESGWVWQVGADGRLRAETLGLDVAASLLMPGQRAAIAGLFQAAQDTAGVELAPPAMDAAPAAHVAAGHRAPVEVTMLGPVAVTAPGRIDPDRIGAATEVVVYLAAHPAGAHPNTLAAALWPRGARAQTRDGLLERVRVWLGTDPIGRPHLATDAGGRLRLGSQVRVDWHVFQALTARSLAGNEARHLSDALALVRGPVLAGHPPGLYAWLAVSDLEREVRARVADAAHRLCGLRLAGGDPHGAMAAARAGLRLATQDELLWRDLLSAAHASGGESLVRETLDELAMRLDERPPQISPQTEALIGELLPSWLATSAATLPSRARERSPGG